MLRSLPGRNEPLLQAESFPHTAKSVKSLFPNLLTLPPVEATPHGGLLMVHRQDKHSGVKSSDSVCGEAASNTSTPSLRAELLAASQIKEMFIGDRGVECRIAAHVHLKWAVENLSPPSRSGGWLPLTASRCQDASIITPGPPRRSELGLKQRSIGLRRQAKRTTGFSTARRHH
jgi:hypothetical protein